MWLLDTLDRVSKFPSGVRTKVGFALYLAQIGAKHDTAKPLHGLDASVWEVRAEDRSGTYRAVYVVHLRYAVYVLHAFQKKAKSEISTPRQDMNVIRARLMLAGEIDSRAGGQR